MKTKLLLTIIFGCLLIYAEAQQNSLPPTDVPRDTTDKKVFTFVEHQPEFPGGVPALLDFLKNNIKYPRKERNKDIQGKVLIQFVVDEAGKVTNVTVKKGVSPGIDKEAVRVVKMLPDFTPGTQQGKAVKVYYNLPINFRFE